MSSTSSSSLQFLPRAPVPRTGSFGEARKCMKRSPSFSVLAKGSDVSSDKEKNFRTKQTKKVRRGADHRVNKVLPSQEESPARRPRINLQRYPSMFGTELLHNRCPQPSAYSQPAPSHLLGQIPATYTFFSHPLYPARASSPLQLQHSGENDLVCEPVDIMIMSNEPVAI